MSDDPVAAYRKALKIRSEAAKRINTFSEMFRSVSDELRSFNSPMHTRDVKIDASTWPTAQPPSCCQQQ